MAHDIYHTIEREATAEIKVKGSRFIGESFLVDDADKALKRWQQVRRHEHAATHHCYAFHVGVGHDVEFKYSDDGEPNGTAGKPIYDVIVGRELTNTLVVVTRYFGGTRLGTGGLVRAYSDAAATCLDASGKRRRFLVDHVRVTLDFSLYDRLVRLLQKYDAKAVQTDFTSFVDALVAVRQSDSDAFVAELTEISGGKAGIDKIPPGRKG